MKKASSAKGTPDHANWEINVVENVVPVWIEQASQATTIYFASPYITGDTLIKIAKAFKGEKDKIHFFTDLSEHLYVNKKPASSTSTLRSLCESYPDIRIYNVTGLHAKSAIFLLENKKRVFTNGSQNATTNGKKTNRFESTTVFIGDKSLSRLYKSQFNTYKKVQAKRAEEYVPLAKDYAKKQLENACKEHGVKYGPVSKCTKAKVALIENEEENKDDKTYLSLVEKIIPSQNQRMMILTVFERDEQSDVVWLRAAKTDMSVFYLTAKFETCPKKPNRTPRFNGLDFTVECESLEGFNELEITLNFADSLPAIAFRATFNGKNKLAFNSNDIEKLPLDLFPNNFKNNLRDQKTELRNYICAIITQPTKMPRGERLNDNYFDLELGIPIGTCFKVSLKRLNFSYGTHEHLHIEQID